MEQTSSSVTQWTVQTLHAHVEAMLAELDRRYIALLSESDRRYLDRHESSQIALNAAMAAAEKAVGAALAASKEAVLKAEFASEKRFEGVNEFRATLADQQRTLMPRSEAEAIFQAINSKFDAKLDALEKELAALTLKQTTMEGRSIGGNAMFGWIVAAILLVIAVASFLRGP